MPCIIYEILILPVRLGVHVYNYHSQSENSDDTTMLAWAVSSVGNP